jgi:energy-coupling factor transporter ATP-binding protein EcfA2
MIRVETLRYQYADSEPVLRGLNYTQEPGTSVALLGPNGSGKTTFALHLNGILLGEGRVEVCGIEVNAFSLEAVRKKVGFVFQSAENQLFLPTVLEDVSFGLLNQGVSSDEARQKAYSMLNRLHLDNYADRNPFHLSAGEKRRAALAGVLVMEPDILILDEPTTFLDPPGIRDLAALLNGFRMTKLIITHDARFAETTCAEAAFFERGQVIGRGPTSEILTRYDWR